APRFAVTPDPEAVASSPIVPFVDQLARRKLLQTWQRHPVPQYTAIERVIGEEIYDALSGVKSDYTALRDASARVEKILRSRAVHAPEVAGPKTAAARTSLKAL